METIQFDSGIREYRLEGLGVLRFHPGDPNLYARFLEAAQEISQVEKQLQQQAQTSLVVKKWLKKSKHKTGLNTMLSLQHLI